MSKDNHPAREYGDKEFKGHVGTMLDNITGHLKIQNDRLLAHDKKITKLTGIIRDHASNWRFLWGMVKWGLPSGGIIGLILLALKLLEVF